MTAVTESDLAAIASDLERLGVRVPRSAIACEMLTHNVRNTITDGIWRVAAGEFKAVVKVTVNNPGGDPHWQPSLVPSAWNYWKREAEAYRSGLTQAYRPHGIRGPGLLQVVERTPNSFAIWMEDVDARPAVQIDAEWVSDIAYRLGAAQGSLAARPDAIPAFASRRFLRDYTASKRLGWDLLDSDSSWNHQLIATCFPDSLREGANRLHRERAWFLAVMEQLPRTLCHLDVWPNNIILAKDGSAVLVDWAFAGDGTFGEDIGNLVPDAAFDRFVQADQLPSLATAALKSYLEGLFALGWRGNPMHVELGFYASAIKYDWLVPWMLAKADEEQLDYGGHTSVAAEERYRERGLAMLELTRWAERARQIVRDEPSLVPAELALPTT
jgi:hypothetical protein